jgi:hypothetical protein
VTRGKALIEKARADDGRYFVDGKQIFVGAITAGVLGWGYMRKPRTQRKEQTESIGLKAAGERGGFVGAPYLGVTGVRKGRPYESVF